MKRIQHILFPTDFSETAQNAFRYCLVLADQYQAEITILHAVYPEYETLDLPVVATKATRDKLELAKTAIQSFIELGITQVQVGYNLQQVPVVHSEVEIGSPVGTINRIAHRDHPDLIIMGTKGEHNALEKTFGSVTTGVMEGASCNILVVPENAKDYHTAIVAYATDRSKIAKELVWVASQLLEPMHSIFHVVHVENGKNDPEPIDFSSIEAAFEQNNPAIQVIFHHIKGKSIVDRLEEFVENHDVDLLVMYAPPHSLFDRLFHKSKTKAMAMETKVPLLILKSSHS